MSWWELDCVGKSTYRITIKKWHPGFWLEVYRTLREHHVGRLRALYFTARFVIKC